jgi:VIT1/CCC1 family predicted Fe2+/Mn2+ transporter
MRSIIQPTFMPKYPVMKELALIYEPKGLDAEHARDLAVRQIADRDTALDTPAREELGTDPELGGSPVVAAATSFVLFAIGAIVPVTAFFFLTGAAAVVGSAALSAAGLFTIGALITVFTGRSAVYSGGRQVLIGVAARAAPPLLPLIVVDEIGYSRLDPRPPT